MIEGTVHRVLRGTSTWEGYYEATEIKRKNGWSTNIRKVGRRRLHRKPLKRSSGEGKNKMKMAKKRKPFDYSSDSLPILMVQYRGNHFHTLAKKCAISPMRR